MAEDYKVRLRTFDQVLQADQIDLDKLRQICFTGDLITLIN